MISDWEQQMIEDDGQTLNFFTKRAEGQFEQNKVTDEHLLRLCSNPDIDFTKVKKVNLKWCSEITDQGVVALIDKFGDNLEHLNLWNVNKIIIATLKEISIKCQHLKELVLNFCTNISDDGLQSLCGMSNPNAFEKLWLAGCNKISHQGIVSIVETFPQLKELSVGYCTLLTDETLRVIVEGLPNLTHLYVHDIGLTVLPEDIGDRLPELETLHLSDNKLTKIPRSVSKLKKLKYFWASENPLQQPPLPIAEKGLEAIERYFKELEYNGETTSKKLKVVLLGDGEAGKTTILNLINHKRNPRTKTSDRTIHLSLEKVKITNSDTLEEATFYDCGGQKQYLPGQVPFLTDSALYLLVVSAKDTDPMNYLRFLVLLQARAPGAVVQIILSKCDTVDDPEAKSKEVLDEVNRFIEESRNKDTNNNNDNNNNLRIQPDVMLVSIEEGYIINFWDHLSNKKVQENMLQKIIDLSSQIPVVGQSIPKSWNRIFKFIDVVQTHGHAKPEVLFQKTEERLISSERQHNSNHHSTQRQYIHIQELSKLWASFKASRDENSEDGTSSTATDDDNDAFEDAMMLLEAQGEVYTHNGLVFLRPQFITDLIAPLVDHSLKVDDEKLKEIGCFLRNVIRNTEPNANKILQDSLTKFVRAGTLGAQIDDLDGNNLLLCFLWRNTKELDPKDYASMIKMLKDCGVIFLSSLWEEKENENDSTSKGTHQHPVVLYRLPMEPADRKSLDRAWPAQCPDGKSQFEIRIDFPLGCPVNVAANFVASAHSLGNCPQAWLNGVLVMNNNTTAIRVEYIKGATKHRDYLVFSIRVPADHGLNSKDLMIFLSGANEQMKNEKNQLKGLSYNITWACPKCICRNDGDVQTFPWAPPFSLQTMKQHCDLCFECIDVMDIIDESSVNAKGKDQGNVFEVYNNTKKDLNIIQVKKSDSPFMTLFQYSDDKNISNLSNLKEFEECVTIPVEKTISIAFFNNEKFEVELRDSSGALCTSEWVNVPPSRGVKMIKLGLILSVVFLDKIDYLLNDQSSKDKDDMQEVLNARLKRLESGQRRIESKVDDIPSLFLDIENIKCPYMFKFVTETEFVEEIKGAYNLNNADETIPEQISRKIDEIQNLLDSTKNFVDVFSQDYDGADKKGDDSRRVTNISNKLFGKKKVVYLVLYCGRTFNPMVSYKVENTIYNEKAKVLAKVGATMCTLGIKASVVLNAAGALISAFGYPLSINIDSDSIEKVKSFLDKINNDENDESNAFVGKQDGGLKTPKELDDFHDLLNELEENNKMRQLGTQTDKAKLKGKSWSDALVKADVKMKDGKKFITFVDKSLETGRLGYMKSEVEG